MSFSYNRGPCPVCGRSISGAGFARSSHQAMHVRRGDLLEVFAFNWVGGELDSRIIPPSKEREMKGQGYFRNFELCKAWYEAKKL